MEIFTYFISAKNIAVFVVKFFKKRDGYIYFTVKLPRFVKEN